MTNHRCDARHVRLPRVEIRYDIPDPNPETNIRFTRVSVGNLSLAADRCHDCGKVQHYDYTIGREPERIPVIDSAALLEAVTELHRVNGPLAVHLEETLTDRDGSPRRISTITHLTDERPRVTLRESR